MKHCPKCGLDKPKSEFTKCSRNADGLYYACRKCKGDRVNYRPAWDRKWRYGLENDDYERMLANQQGRCAICNKYRKLFVDHDHATGVVRALLCMQCNSAIGLFGEDPNVIMAAAAYLMTADDCALSLKGGNQ